MDGDDEAQLHVSLRQFGVAAEVVHDAERPSVRQAAALPPRPRFDDGKERIVCVAAVDSDRLLYLGRRLQLLLEHLDLLVVRGEVAVEVEADLADGGDERVARQLGERRHRIGVHVLGVVGVAARRRIDAGLRFGQGDRGLRRGDVCAEDEHAGDAGGPRASEHRVTVAVELR